LNDDTYVSARSREKVLAAARDLGYSPNQAARSLVTRRTGAIAVVLSEPEARLLDDPYRTAVMRAGYRELADIGCQMVLIFSDTREDLTRTVRFLEGGHVDGVLVFAPHRADPLPRALRLLRLPVVFGGQAADLRRGVHVVDFDNENGARLAVSHLVESGRRRVATIAGPQDQGARSTGSRAGARPSWTRASTRPGWPRSRTSRWPAARGRCRRCWSGPRTSTRCSWRAT